MYFTTSTPNQTRSSLSAANIGTNTGMVSRIMPSGSRNVPSTT